MARIREEVEARIDEIRILEQERDVKERRRGYQAYLTGKAEFQI